MADNPTMPTEIVDEETRYVYSHTIDSAGEHSKTLLTAGTVADKNIRVKITTPAGSATMPSESIAANPTVQISESTGLVTASVSASKSVTPTVVPGYISSGTAGTVGVNGNATLQLSTKTAQTYTPGTEDQTIPSGEYLTGVQTIKGDADLIPENIADGVVIFGVTGTHKGGSGLKAKLGNSDEIVLLSGEYGPMGNAEADYIVPVARNDLDVLIDTSHPFEITCSFMMTEYPSEKAAIFGALDSDYPMPALYMDAGGESISYRIPIGTGSSAPSSYETGSFTTIEEEAFPLDTEILVKLTFDGESITVAVNDGSEYEIEQFLDDIAPWPVWASIAYGKDGSTENSLAGVSGSYFNVDKCSIIQWIEERPTFGAEDEGKVVSGEALIEQTSRTIIENGTYDTTTNDEAVVAVPRPVGTRGKLGASTIPENLPELNAFTGDLENDYITPVSFSDGEDITIDIAQPYKISVVFRLTELPNSQAAIFGQTDEAHAVPAMHVEAGGNNIHYAIPYELNQESTHTIYRVGNLFSTDTPLPLNTDITATIEYDGSNHTISIYDGTSLTSKKYYDELIPSYQTVESALLLGYDEREENGLAGVSGATINTEKTCIIQGTTRLWGGVLPMPADRIMAGNIQPTSDMGSDGDMYVQTYPSSANLDPVLYVKKSGVWEAV